MLSSQVKNGLPLLGYLLSQPNFTKNEVATYLAQQKTELAIRATDPMALSRLWQQKLAYVENSPLANTGYANKKSLNQFTVESLKSFYLSLFQPENISLQLVGDITAKAAKELLEESFNQWQKSPDKSLKLPVSKFNKASLGKVFLIDNPTASQSMISYIQTLDNIAGQDPSLALVDDVISGSFSSRLNMNLREDKGWSYGVWSNYTKHKNHNFWSILSPIQNDKTQAAIAEIKRELSAVFSREKNIE